MNSIVFTSPLGFIALGAIPLLVLIYCIRERAQQRRVATLFLMPPVKESQTTTRRFARFTALSEFWTQAVALILLTSILAGLFVIRNSREVQAIIVLDQSASMYPHRNQAMLALEQLKERKKYSEVSVYGSFLQKLITNDYQPLYGTHDVTKIYAQNGFLSKSNTDLYLITDNAPKLRPPQVVVIPVGYQTRSDFNNVGVVSAAVDREGVLQFMLKNFSQAQQKRSWSVRNVDIREQRVLSATQPAAFEILPGQTLVQRVKLPADYKTIELQLTSDTYTPDDRVPLVAASNIAITLKSEGLGAVRALAESLLKLPRVAPAREATDFLIQAVTDRTLAKAIPGIISYQFPESVSSSRVVSFEPIPNSHPLLDNLPPWTTIRTMAGAQLGITEDEVLLWREDQPYLLFNDRLKQLIINASLESNSLVSQPGFILLVERLVRRVTQQVEDRQGERRINFQGPGSLLIPERAEKLLFYPISFQTGTTEYGKSIEPIDSEVLKRAAGYSINSSLEPGWFEILDADNKILARGASTLFDPLESSYVEPSATEKTQAPLEKEQGSNSAKHYSAVTKILAYGVLLLVLLSYYFIERRIRT